MRNNRRPKIEKISVAVIGEGPTEWHYFNDLRQTERLRFSLKPSLPKSSNFRSIIQKAKQFAREGYDYVYCVIDLDYIMNDATNQSNYSRLKENTRRQYQNIEFFECMPCIEFWFLLHFRKTTRIYRSYREIKPDIEVEIENYDKSEGFLKNFKIYQHLKANDKLPVAIENAVWVIAQKNNNDNPLHPFSEIHMLLQSIFLELE